ncbi:MAG: hypothetical protein Q4E81_08250 [Succinatimonas sp.]|nr:hypothetical protein [Succinatimonas sp.]
MPMPERYHPECPPNAHKVIRPPENEVFAILAVKVPDSEEQNGMENVCDMLSLMSKKPIVLCSEKMEQLIKENAKNSEIEPSFIRNNAEDKAYISYIDGAQGEVLPFYDWAFDPQSFKDFLPRLQEKCLLCVDMPSMFILRSISTVYPWDKLLAQQFLGQYLQACETLTAEDKKLLEDVRYGRFDALKVEDESKTAYKFLRLERKLFLSYPTED